MAKKLAAEATTTSTAPVETVWRLLEDADTYARWGAWDESGYDRPGDTSPHGVGAIRRFRTGRITSVERVVEVEVGHLLVYDLISGLPLRNYRATVTLAEDTSAGGSGTIIRWGSTFDRTLGGIALRPGLRRLYRKVGAALAAGAEREAAERR